MPHYTLNTGAKIPAIGMGTFTGTRGTAKAEGGTMYETTKMWLRSGGRLVDAASNYLNEGRCLFAASPPTCRTTTTHAQTHLLLLPPFNCA